MYKIQGVTDFTFYIHSIGPGVERVLQYYADHSADTGVTVNVFSWNLPLQSQMKIRTEAQFTALNDCNMKFINRVKYAAMVVG